MLQNLHWSTLEIMRTQTRIIIFYKIIRLVETNPLASYYMDTYIRTNQIQYVALIRTYAFIHMKTCTYIIYDKYSLYNITLIQWNHLPTDVAVTVNALKPPFLLSPL